MIKVLAVVEDDKDMRMLISMLLSSDPDLEIVGEAQNAEEAIELAGGTGSDVIILDHFIDGDMMGLQVAPFLKAVAPDTKILMFSSHDLAVEAKREPAIDLFLRKKDFAHLLPTVKGLISST
jgi:DNA-binding NarL/FixJ family response regulator